MSTVDNSGLFKGQMKSETVCSNLLFLVKKVSPPGSLWWIIGLKAGIVVYIHKLFISHMRTINTTTFTSYRLHSLVLGRVLASSAGGPEFNPC